MSLCGDAVVVLCPSLDGEAVTGDPVTHGGGNHVAACQSLTGGAVARARRGGQPAVGQLRGCCLGSAGHTKASPPVFHSCELPRTPREFTQNVVNRPDRFAPAVVAEVIAAFRQLCVPWAQLDGRYANRQPLAGATERLAAFVYWLPKRSCAHRKLIRRLSAGDLAAWIVPAGAPATPCVRPPAPPLRSSTCLRELVRQRSQHTNPEP